MSLIAYPNALKYREQATDPWSTATIFAKADLESLADKFDTTETYTEGEIVLYQGGMYKCKAGGAGPGAWDATEWDQTTVEAELAALQTEIDSARNTLTQLDGAKAAKVDLTDISQTSPNCTVTNGIAKGTYFYLDGVLTRATANISENAPFTSSNCETVTAGGLNDLWINLIKIKSDNGWKLFCFNDGLYIGFFTATPGTINLTTAYGAMYTQATAIDLPLPQTVANVYTIICSATYLSGGVGFVSLSDNRSSIAIKTPIKYWIASCTSLSNVTPKLAFISYGNWE